MLEHTPPSRAACFLMIKQIAPASSTFCLHTVHQHPGLIANTSAVASCHANSTISLLSNQTLNPTAVTAAAKSPPLPTPHEPQNNPIKPAQGAARYALQSAAMHCWHSGSSVLARRPPPPTPLVILACCIRVCAAHRSADNTPGCGHPQHILHH